jgi:integrase
MGARVRVDPRTKRLYLDLHVGGRRKRVFSELPATPRNIKIMQAKAETIEREAFLGTLDLARHFPEQKKEGRLTFTQLWDEWRAKKMNDVTPLTMHWYDKAARVRLLPFWGKRRLDELEPRHFDEFKAVLVGEKLAPRTMNIELALLKQLLRFAADRGYGVDGLTRWITFQRRRPSTIQPFSFDEKARCLKVLPLRWRPYFEVAFGTGLRPSEQLALKWDRVDWKRKKLQVVEGWRDGQITALKVISAHREVDLLPPVLRALERQRLVAAGSELVFPSSRGGYLRLDNLRHRVWRPALEKAKLAQRDVYTTRHTFATHALASGEDPGWVAKMLGHTTLQMIFTTYYRYLPNLVRRDGTLLAKRLGPRRI